MRLNGIDGPYILGEDTFYVDAYNQVNRTRTGNTVDVVTNNADQDRFDLQLMTSHTAPESNYQQPQRTLVISDIEGNIDALIGFLRSNTVIDSELNWTFQGNHLVLLGDFVDRGENVLAVLWLVYKLEQQAKDHGGAVHFILGNHEIMNVQGDWRYTRAKYWAFAMTVGTEESEHDNCKAIYSNNSELGKWLRSKNVIEKIGGTLFLHAGLSPEILKYKLTLDQINSIVRSNIDFDLYRSPQDDEQANFLMGPKGPYWYRGLVKDHKYYARAHEHQLDQLLAFYNASQIILGHCVVNNISSDYNGKVVRVDVTHGQQKNSGKTKGLLLENSEKLIVDDLGNKVAL